MRKNPVFRFLALLGLTCMTACARDGGWNISTPATEGIAPWINASVRVQAENGHVASGFLVTLPSADPKAPPRTILVTNKHVIDENDEKRREAKFINVFFNSRNAEGKIVPDSFKIPFVYQGRKLWVEHPEPLIDVMAFDVSVVFKTHPEITHAPVPVSLIPPKDVMQREKIDAGAETLIIGYPLDFKYTSSNLPLIRQGIIASKTGEDVFIHGRFPSGKVDNFSLPGFLLDGIILPGSSGSPVVLKPSSLSPRRPPFLLGIVSRTTLSSVTTANGEFPVMAGIGIIFGAASIIETLAQFDAPAGPSNAAETKVQLKPAPSSP